MYGESKITIIFNEEEKAKLKTTAEVLREIGDIFSKHGLYLDTEITRVRDAEDIVRTILNDESF